MLPRRFEEVTKKQPTQKTDKHRKQLLNHISKPNGSFQSHKYVLYRELPLKYDGQAITHKNKHRKFNRLRIASQIMEAKQEKNYTIRERKIKTETETGISNTNL